MVLLNGESEEKGVRPREQASTMAYNAYFVVFRHTLIVCLKRYFGKLIPAEHSSVVTFVQQQLFGDIRRFKQERAVVTGFCRPAGIGLHERGYLDPQEASQQFPKPQSVDEFICTTLRLARDDILRVLQGHRTVDKQWQSHTIGPFAAGTRVAVLAVANKLESGQWILQDERSAAYLLDESLHRQPCQQGSVVLLENVHVLFHIIPVVPGIRYGRLQQ